jgi:SAM-dependent methyltransferase
MSADAAFPIDLHLGRMDETEESARAVIPILLELFQPRSVVDVGCGTGIWLSVCEKLGISDIHGIDGAYSSVADLKIDKTRFTPVDLEQPFGLDRVFDCVVSLEVAEHVSAEHAEQFVACLVKMAPIVVFSAAIPFQGGFHHVNEQWPDYWAERFRRSDYHPVDAIRWRIWHAPHVLPYTKQNTILFVRRDVLDRYPKLREEYERGLGRPLTLVHPHYYLRAADQRHRSLREAFALVPKTLKAAARRWWGRLRGVPNWHLIGVPSDWEPPHHKNAKN